MADVVREDLLVTRSDALVQMNRERRDSRLARIQGDGAELQIIICAGPGRCMFPVLGDADGKRICPFCLIYDEARTHDDAHAKRAVRIFVAGN